VKLDYSLIVSAGEQDALVVGRLIWWLWQQ